MQRRIEATRLVTFRQEPGLGDADRSGPGLPLCSAALVSQAPIEKQQVDLTKSQQLALVRLGRL